MKFSVSVFWSFVLNTPVDQGSIKVDTLVHLQLQTLWLFYQSSEESIVVWSLAPWLAQWYTLSRPLRLSVLDPVRQTPPSLQPTVINSNGSVWLSKVLNYSPPAWPCQAFSLKQNCISKDTSKTLKIVAEKLLELYQTTSYCGGLFWYFDYSLSNPFQKLLVGLAV